MHQNRPSQPAKDAFPVEISLPGAEAPVQVGKVLCIGRNYARHAAEMKSDVPEVPMVFLKPASAVVRSGQNVVLPSRSENVHHEVELVAVIGQGGKNISAEAALDHVAAYGVGLDMTARDVQSDAKKAGHPWSVAKGFDTFAPLGELVAASEVPDPQNLPIQLEVNEEVRQKGNTRDMIFSVADLIAYCSQIFTLFPGDLLYTGTPEGVAQVRPGDTLEATVDGWPTLTVGVVKESR